MKHVYVAFMIFMTGLGTIAGMVVFDETRTPMNRIFGVFIVAIFAVSVHWGWGKFKEWRDYEREDKGDAS